LLKLATENYYTELGALLLYRMFLF